METPQNNPVEKIIEVIKRGHKFIVASHVNPDGDAIGSIIALGLIIQNLGKHVDLINESGVPYIYSFLPGSTQIKDVINGEIDHDALFVLDSGEIDRIGSLAGNKENFPIIVNIDHHVSPEPWGDIQWIESKTAAVGCMIYRLADALQIKLTSEIAQNLYTAIMTDTGSFRYGNTSPEVLLIASKLAECGAEPSVCARHVYLSFSQNRLKLLGEVLSTVKTQLDGKLATMSVDLETMARTGTKPVDLDGFTDYIRGLPEVEVAALIRQEPSNGYKLSLRSTGRVDVSKLAGKLSGGGHRMAAGGYVSGNYDKAEEALIEKVSEALTELG